MALTRKQQQLRTALLSPFRLKFYFLRKLPMALISGLRISTLEAGQCSVELPFSWLNKNPFHSIYFAVQSMAAELSTAAPILIALKGIDADVALIIVDMKAGFSKKAQTKTTFTCIDLDAIEKSVASLKQADDTATVTLESIGRDTDGEEVSRFEFTWSFKRRN